MKEYHKIQSVFMRHEKTKRFTDEFSMPEFEYLYDCPWVLTEKVDGTNIRVMWDGETIFFGGKTDNAQMPIHLIRKLQELFEEKTKMFKEIFDGPVCLYGEGYGAKIQKGGGNYKPNGVDFVLFDVRVGYWWLQRKDVEDIAQKLGIEVVPILGEKTLREAVEFVKTGFKSQWGDFLAEGVVMRPKVELQTRRGDRIITKLKHRDFI